MDEEIRHFTELLSCIGRVQARRMFGATGFFLEGRMFALAADGCLYLKTDARSRAAFTARGLQPFRYRRRGRLVALGYHAAPAEALDDPEAMRPWAERAWAAARRSRG